MTNEKAKTGRKDAGIARAFGLFCVRVVSFQDRLISRLDRFGCPDFLISCFAYLIGFEIFAFFAGWRSSSR